MAATRSPRFWEHRPKTGADSVAWRIRGGHFTNQGTNLVWHDRPSDAVSALPRPEQAKPTVVPRDDYLRLHHVHGRGPATPCLREPRPKDSVGPREAKTWAAGSVHDGDLVPERDDFQVQRDA